MLLDGFAFSSYRSFGPALQAVGPLQKVSLVIGQNNTGKSNVLRFAVRHLPALLQHARSRTGYGGFQELDRHLGPPTEVVQFAIGIVPGSATYEEWMTSVKKLLQRGNLEQIERLLSSPALTLGTRAAWFCYEVGRERVVFSPAQISELVESGSSPMKEAEWNSLWSTATNQSGGALETWVSQLLEKISPVHTLDLSVAEIPAVREIKSQTPEAVDYSGAGLIERLAKHQNPAYNEQHLKDKFEKINRFLRYVTGVESASIEIPSARDTILVHLKGRTLPLASLGTGIHEVLIIAAAATVCSGHLICIEEPEIHLHPGLQRKLLLFLQHETDNQYLIATHSAHLLDETSCAVLHVRSEGQCSVVRPAITDHEKFQICCELGYRASDLLQANCVIWVEGPSDRIYLVYWLSQLEPAAQEGIDFSVMFYGGRLLSHLSADDPEVHDFISLRRLNRNISIIMDSDRKKARQRINPTKQRVRKEFERGAGIAWVTKGREVENYISPEILEAAVGEVHPRLSFRGGKNLYDRALAGSDNKGRRTFVDKVKVARSVISRNPQLDTLDLRERLGELVRFIRESNKEG